MRFIQHSITFLFTISAVIFLFWTSIQHNAQAAVTIPTFHCTQLTHLDWAQMNTQQKQLADACDAAEANHHWNLAYGHMDTQDLTAAIVYDPL